MLFKCNMADARSLGATLAHVIQTSGVVAFCLLAASSLFTQSPAKPSTQSSPLPQLVDITASTGIHFQHLSSPEQKYIMESMSAGVAMIDYDGDGWPDIYFTNAQSVEMAKAGKRSRSALFHNNHDGTFTDVTDKAGVAYPCWANGVSVGDYNNDGWPDLLVTCFQGVVLYRNNGDGTFTDVTKQVGLAGDKGWAMGSAFGDYDADGFADLFVSRYIDISLNNLPVFGSSKTCQYHGIDVQCGPRGLKGLPDSLYHNNGDGTFTEVSEAVGVSDPQKRLGLTAVWTDFDQDGHIDLLVANDGQPNYLYRNDGFGHFKEIAYTAGVAVSQDGVEQANMGVALGDYLHTGRFSIFISHFSDEYAVLYRNDGNMNFSDESYASGVAAHTTPYVQWGDAFLDWRNNGWQDIFVVGGHVYPQVDTAEVGTKFREPMLLFENQRNDTLKDISKLVGPAIQVPIVGRGVACGDLFNDGRMEIVVETLNGEPVILQPQGLAPNHWISFQLEGTKSNRLALNARIKATAGDLVQTDQVLSGGSYLSQSDLRVHFGLAAHDYLDKAEITWPSGKVEALINLAADRFYKVKEGQGIVSSEPPRH
jgi:enediyne biosynthesis protein E4